MDEIARLKLLKLKALEEEQKRKAELPHLHLYPFYKWSEEFFRDTSSIGIICAANQVSKSSTQIRKDIEWATNKSLWPKLWPDLRPGQVPGQFWYLYPTRDICTVEFEEKWKQFLPSGEMKNHPERGWTDEWDNKKIFAIHFNSRVSIYFKTYAQDQEKLQAGSVYKLSCDEELPEELLDELSFRVLATKGYMSFAFTATQGQEYWRQAVETRERLPQAKVWQVSLYDCLKYADGSKSPWTVERIKAQEAICRNEAEVQRRIHGRFVVDSGRKYGTFERGRNVVKPYAIPKNWLRFSGVDIGGGGEGHPAAISFIAVRPDFKKGAVYKFWRGERGVLTTTQDILAKYMQIRENDIMTSEVYDWASKDFGTIAARSGTGFIKADKSRDAGAGLLNSLFRNQMLDIFDTHEPLIREFLSLLESTPKNKAKDDGIDATRYANMQIPWDFSDITVPYEKATSTKLRTREDDRKDFLIESRKEDILSIEEELEFWDSQM